MAHIKPADQLASDLAGGAAPNYVWISPDTRHDMHGLDSKSANTVGMPWYAYPPNFMLNQTLILQGDQCLKSLVATIMTSKAWR